MALPLGLQQSPLVNLGASAHKASVGFSNLVETLVLQLDAMKGPFAYLHTGFLYPFCKSVERHLPHIPVTLGNVIQKLILLWVYSLESLQGFQPQLLQSLVIVRGYGINQVYTGLTDVYLSTPHAAFHSQKPQTPF